MKKIILLLVALPFILYGCGQPTDQQLLKSAIDNSSRLGTYTISTVTDNSTSDSKTEDKYTVNIQDANNVQVKAKTAEGNTELYLKDGVFYLGNNDSYYTFEGEKIKNFYMKILNKSSSMQKKYIDKGEVTGTDTTIEVDGKSVPVRKIDVYLDSEYYKEVFNNINLDEHPYWKMVVNFMKKMMKSAETTLTYYVDPATKTLLKTETVTNIGMILNQSVTTTSTIDFTKMGEAVTIEFPKKLDDAKTLSEAFVGSILEKGIDSIENKEEK